MKKKKKVKNNNLGHLYIRQSNYEKIINESVY